MLIDEELSWVGISNLDARSMELNFEGNLVVFGKRFADTVEAMLRADLEKCRLNDPCRFSAGLSFRFGRALFSTLRQCSLGRFCARRQLAQDSNFLINMASAKPASNAVDNLKRSWE